MSPTLYIFSFIAGLLAVNGVPHFVKGVTGQKFQTPFGRPSPAVVNAVWGWVNFAVAVVLMHFAHPWGHLYRAAVLFAAGSLLMALVLSYVWTIHPEYNKAKKS